MATPEEQLELYKRKYGVSNRAPAQQGLAAPGVTTIPLPQEQAPLAPAMPAGQSPALTSGMNGKPSGAPAMAKPSNPQVGAGGTTARDSVLKADPKTQIEVAEQSAQAISSSTGATAKMPDGGVAQKKQVNEALAAQGMNPKDSFQQLYEQELQTLEARHKSGEITKREFKGWKNRWKNLFNTIPEEDFGLFMMDFGLRMMTASGQGEPIGASFGMAGSGALQGAVARRDTKQAMGMAREQQAFDRAVAKSGLRERARDSQVESTESGLIERGPNGEWSPIINPETGKPYQRSYAGQDGYKGEKSWLYDYGRRIGKSDEEVWDIINGAMPDQQRRDRYEELVLAMIKDASYTDKDPVLSKKYREFTAEDIQAWIENMMGGRRGALQ